MEEEGINDKSESITILERTISDPPSDTQDETKSKNVLQEKRDKKQLVVLQSKLQNKLKDQDPATLPQPQSQPVLQNLLVDNETLKQSDSSPFDYVSNREKLIVVAEASNTENQNSVSDANPPQKTNLLFDNLMKKRIQPIEQRPQIDSIESKLSDMTDLNFATNEQLLEEETVYHRDRPSPKQTCLLLEKDKHLPLKKVQSEIKAGEKFEEKKSGEKVEAKKSDEKVQENKQESNNSDDASFAPWYMQKQKTVTTPINKNITEDIQPVPKSKPSSFSVLLKKVMSEKVKQRARQDIQEAQEKKLAAVLKGDIRTYEAQKMLIDKQSTIFQDTTIRWEYTTINDFEENKDTEITTKSCFTKKKKKNQEQELSYQEQERLMLEFQNTVPIHLSRRERAMKNWQILHVKISLLRALSLKMSENKKESTSCKSKLINYFDSQTIHPDNNYKFLWEGFICVIYLFSIFSIPFLIAFQMRGLGNIYLFDIAIDYIQLIDISLTFFTQISKKNKVDETYSAIRFHPSQIKRMVQVMYSKKLRDQNFFGDPCQILSFEHAWGLIRILHDNEFPHVKVGIFQVFTLFSKTSTIEGRIHLRELQDVVIKIITDSDLIATPAQPATQLLQSAKQNSKNYETEFLKISSAYIRGNLFFDLLSCLPPIMIRHSRQVLLWGEYVDESLPHESLVWIQLTKMLRFSQIYRMKDFAKKLEEFAIRKNFKRRFEITNFMNIFDVLLQLTLFIHICSCIQIDLFFRLDGWISDLHPSPKELIEVQPLFTPKSMRFIYFNAVYFVSSTITTVGFGEINALSGTIIRKDVEMVFCMFLELFGILAFAITSNRFFNQLKHVNIKEKINEVQTDSQEWLLAISKVHKNSSLNHELYDIVKDHMRNSLALSTIQSFQKSRLFHDLPPQIQKRLLMASLQSIYNTFLFFFEDKQQKFKTPYSLVRKILSNLDCQLYPVNSVLIERNQQTDYLFMCARGSMNLIGYDIVEHSEVSLVVTTLGPGSWYGDHQILTGSKSLFTLIAANKDTKNYHESHVMVYQVKAEKLKKWMSSHPQYKIQQILRSELRRAYWLRCLKQGIETYKLQNKLIVFDSFGYDINTNDDVHELIMTYYRFLKARIRDPKYNPQYLPNVIDVMGLKQGIKKNWFASNPFKLYQHMTGEQKKQQIQKLLHDFQSPHMIFGFVNYSVKSMHEQIQSYLNRRMPWLDINLLNGKTKFGELSIRQLKNLNETIVSYSRARMRMLADARRAMFDDALEELKQEIGSDEEQLQKANNKCTNYQDMHDQLLQGILKKRKSIKR